MMSHLFIYRYIIQTIHADCLSDIYYRPISAQTIRQVYVVSNKLTSFNIIQVTLLKSIQLIKLKNI